MTFADPMVLPADVVLVPVEALQADLRARLTYRTGDYALTRPRSRAPTSIVDASTAGLLQQFREPQTIVDAIIRYSQLERLDPRETLESAFPVLQRFVNTGLLLAAGSELSRPIARTFRRGDQVGGFQIVEAVQVIVDTEVYLARTGDGAFAALKIARAGAEDRVGELVAREACTLGAIRGGVAPGLLEHGELDGRPFIATCWHHGVDAHEAAAGARACSTEGSAELLRIATNIAHAYADLHEQGVLQGDVHPRNVLVGPEQEVTLVDFGMAHFLAADQTSQTLGRRGAVELYMEPELAAARLAGSPALPISAAGEQYSVAALLYFLVTGGYTHNFMLEAEETWRQIAADPPLAFRQHGVEDLPTVERTLCRALSKNAAARFPSMREMATALDLAASADLAAAKTDRSAPSPVPGAAELVLDDVLERLALAGPLRQSGLEPPTSSFNNGAAGLAYFLLRMAIGRDDERLLALADVWSIRAMRDAETTLSTAFVNPDLELTPEVFGPTSLYHTAVGVHCVAALIAHARGDDQSLRRALAAFLSAAGPPCAHLDVSFGRAGILLGCSILVDALADAEEAVGVRALGDALLSDLWCDVGTAVPGTHTSPVASLGAAHGWAGILFAVLRWAESSGAPLPDTLRARLDELAALATPVGRGLCWPRSTEVLPAEDALRASWCNGAAGFVYLWTLAERQFGDARYGELARSAAWTAYDAPQAGGDLCCGLSGRAYALLNLYKHSGERIWLHRARDLAERAALRIRAHARRRDSLYNGEIGVALLAADLHDPEHSCMPLYEAES